MKVVGLFLFAFLPEAPCSAALFSISLCSPETLTLAPAGLSPAQRKREGAAIGPLRSFSILRLPLLTPAPLPHPAQAQCNERERERGATTLGVNTIRRIKDIMSKIKLIVEGKRVKQQLLNVIRKFFWVWHPGW